MACTNPYVLREGLVPTPCRKCKSCRIDQKGQLIHRVLMECDTTKGDVGFLTTTYDEKHLPDGASLRREDSTLFLKRFRKAIAAEWPGRKIRYVRVGEYGRGGRPHYHYVLFGIRCQLANRTRTKDGGWQCECRPCQLVRQAWGVGNVSLEPFGQNAAKYIAKYCLKKMTDPKDPRLKGREAEFCTRSTRPGLGRAAIDVIAKRTLANWNAAARVGRRFDDVPAGQQRGRHMMPFDQYTLRKLREACGRDPKAPIIARVRALVRDGDCYKAAMERKLFAREVLKAELSKKYKQAEQNKQARDQFGSRTRWG